MCKKLFFGLVCWLLIGKLVFGTGFTEIRYTITDLGSNQWQYTYHVSNLALSAPIHEFTIWFDYGLYKNLTIATVDPPAGNWDEIVWQPTVGLSNGGYDAMATSLSISAGQTVSDFCVHFDWLGTGAPGSQFYEIINPIDYTRIDSGTTILIPEPTTITLMILGGLSLLRRTRV